MVREAEAHAEEDQKRRESVETKNVAENLAYQTEKLLKEQGDKVASDKKAKVESAVEDLKKAIETDDVEQIKAKMEALNAAMQEVSADLYAQTKADAPGAEEAAGGAPAGEETKSEEDEEKKDEGEVIDADFEMVDDDKKE